MAGQTPTQLHETQSSRVETQLRRVEEENDKAKSAQILATDLKVFAAFNQLYKEITQLLALENFRENEKLLKYGDTKSARNIMFTELQKLIEGNPLFDVKLPFPSFKASQLRTLINQRLYKVLNILEFSSTRQNMPLIVHDKDGKL
ncbi:unnamed protein product [Brassica oleracea var. botrytis]|uniref:TPR1-like CTLH-containing domain-containing protein n=2 Tax=Brassica oleracea TaxID=3712 RepID=A0A0D2ZSZ8_BRAOL|nr:unnamed protein product [Brassica oleracea]